MKKQYIVFDSQDVNEFTTDVSFTTVTAKSPKDAVEIVVETECYDPDFKPKFLVMDLETFAANAIKLMAVPTAPTEESYKLKKWK